MGLPANDTPSASSVVMGIPANDTPEKPEELEELNWTLDDFDVGLRLGSGKFGNVYMARERRSGYIVAMKRISKKKILKEKLPQNIEREINIQKSLWHENVLRLYAYFWDDRHIYIIIEFAQYGELFKHTRRQPSRRFDCLTTSVYMKQMMSAIKYLHDRGVIHRDIKPENILIGQDHRLKLADFGWSVVVEEEERRNTMCGTVDYLAPEMLQESSEHRFEVDIWGLGILMYELLVGKAPFESKSVQLTCQNITRAPIKFYSWMDADAIDLIQRLLKKNPMKRITLEEALVHPFITRFENMEIPKEQQPKLPEMGNPSEEAPTPS